ncbi:MAG: 30S ribosomal protein S6 [Campylobacterota bacterium]|nr:30S ribosomal protein S6 [Campylobacterota bacterium]
MARIRHYETMFIVKPTLTEEETQAQIQTVRSNIEKNGGTIVSYDDIGTKNLAYEIEKNKRGYYYVIYFTAPSESINELERNYRVNESILRFIFIKSESKTEIKQWTAMSDEAAKRSEKTAAK